MRYAFATIAVLFSACAAPPPAISPEERARHMGAIYDCIGEQGAQLDDGVSNARTIARSVVRACGAPIWAAIDAGTAGQPASYRNAYADRFLQQSDEFAAQFVMRYRAERRRLSN